MTQDEQRMLQDLADKIAQTPPPPRDAEAEEFIRKNIGNRPDALYLMTQTVLIQNMALQHAQQELQQSRQSGNTLPAAPGGAFLGQSGSQNRSAGYGSQYSAPPPPQYASQYAAPSPSPASPAPAAPSGAPSFLRGAAQTAAGVAAGAFAFEGIRSLFSHPAYGGGGGFFGGGAGIGGYAPQVDDTVVNNYYDSPQGDDRGNDFGGGSDPVDVNNYDDNSDNNFDAGNFDDGGGFDNSGGGDDNNFS